MHEFRVRLKADALTIGQNLVKTTKSRAIILPQTIRGWLRSGAEEMLLEKKISVCHNLKEGHSSKNEKTQKRFKKDLELGYHELGYCVENGGECPIFPIWSQKGSKLVVYPIFICNTDGYEPVGGTLGKGYRKGFVTSPRTREDSDQPFRSNQEHGVFEVDAPVKMGLRNPEKEEIGLLLETLDYLSEKGHEKKHQVGGHRNEGFGIVELSIKKGERKECREKFKEKLKKWKEEFSIKDLGGKHF